jgi:hypothetical protein
MVQGKDTSCGGRDARGGRGGQGGRARNTSSNVPRKASELQACKDLEGHIFTLAQETRAKMETCFARLRRRRQRTLEPSTVTMRPKNGPAKSILLAEPIYSSAIKTRHAERVWATREQLNCKMTSLTAEQNEI